MKIKFPAAQWEDINLDNLIKKDKFFNFNKFIDKCGGFFFDSDKLPTIEFQNNEKVLYSADKILNNEFQYFFNEFKSLGTGPDWFLNPFENIRGSDQSHWCDIDHFDNKVGDVKFIWEPSRFAWVYTLARAYVTTKDEKYSKKFWQLLESWLEQNQPNIGHNYMCGQECAIRVFAMCFGLFVFANTTHATQERIAGILKAIHIHADRIAKNISYAISTRTNHSITEAAGIYTVGLLFPFFKKSGYWRGKGKQILVEEGLKQIYDDGSYIQHSMNYHRLMLQDYIWILRLADINQDQFPDTLTKQVEKAVDFIYQLQDDSGRVPNYGANDGALIIPLNSCEYLNYKPVIQAGYYLFNKEKLYDNGLWSEDLLWLFGKDALDSRVAEIPRIDFRAEAGGYYTTRKKNSWAMIRCHSFKDRPSHADMLTLDLWHKGINILRDSGSYQYNCEPLWQNYFSSTSAHNTVAVDALDQMTKGTRFMWFDWTKSKIILSKIFQDAQLKLFQGEHYGYHRDGINVIHRRAILSAEDSWVIIDDIVGSGEHDIELFWHLADCDIDVLGKSVTLKTDQGHVGLSVISSDETMKCQFLRGDEKRPIGWESLYYGQRNPLPVFIVSARASLPLRVITLVCTGNVPGQIKLAEGNVVSWVVRDDQRQCKVLLNSIEQSSSSVFNSYTFASETVVF